MKTELENIVLLLDKFNIDITAEMSSGILYISDIDSMSKYITIDNIIEYLTALGIKCVNYKLY